MSNVKIKLGESGVVIEVREEDVSGYVGSGDWHVVDDEGGKKAEQPEQKAPEGSMQAQPQQQPEPQVVTTPEVAQAGAPAPSQEPNNAPAQPQQ